MGIKVWGPYMGHYGYGDNGIQSWKYIPNSAGGVGAYLSFYNSGNRTFKYVTFNFVAYNSVGDKVTDGISGEAVRSGQHTGFVEPNQWVSKIFWENLWYNNSISRIEIKDVVIQYSDDSEETIPGDEIEYEKKPGGGGGCYVATCVYGSYDCPEVWTLRRYRDYTLAETWYGRAFIHTYYAISPTIVRMFGDTKWFKKMWKGKLDRMVADLRAKGIEDTPYNDREW